MKRIRLTLLFAASVLVVLALAPSAQAWVRHESANWVWYVPNSSWVDAQSAAGIDVSSPTGALYVGEGFSSSAVPVTHKWVVRYLKRSHALDLHPLRKVKIGRGNRVHGGGGIVRKVYKWRGYRTDRHESVRGVLTVDIMNGGYGFASYDRVAPKRLYKKWARRLKFIEKHILLVPHSQDWGYAFP